MVNLRKRLAEIKKPSLSQPQPKSKIDIRKRLERLRKRPRPNSTKILVEIEQEIDRQIIEQKKHCPKIFICKVPTPLNPLQIEKIIEMYKNAGWSVLYQSGTLYLRPIPKMEIVELSF